MGKKSLEEPASAYSTKQRLARNTYLSAKEKNKDRIKGKKQAEKRPLATKSTFYKT